VSSDGKPWAREHTPHLAVVCTPGVRISVERGVYLPVCPSVARGYSSPMRSTRHARTWQTSATNEDVNAGAGARADYPYRSPTTVMVKGRNTVLAILKDAGIQPRDPKYRSSRTNGRCTGAQIVVRGHRTDMLIIWGWDRSHGRAV
jgi:hypothetical protein